VSLVAEVISYDNQPVAFAFAGWTGKSACQTTAWISISEPSAAVGTPGVMAGSGHSGQQLSFVSMHKKRGRLRGRRLREIRHEKGSFNTVSFGSDSTIL
jgi:hypothetical protein